MNIVISTDDHFVMPAKVMLTSFFLNNAGESHNIYFLHSTIKPENLAALDALVTSFHSRFIPVPIRESDFDGFQRSNIFPVQVYFRLILSKYLPETEDRALWLDVDLIVNGSLRELYDLDFDGNFLAGCTDVKAADRSVIFGAPSDSIYVNSGVMLYNTVAMRQYTLADYATFYKKYESTIQWYDQDILNGMFAQNIKVLDPNVYNAQVWFSYPLPRDCEKTVRQTARIIHFVGLQKPWRRSSTHPAGNIWDEYYMRLCNRGPIYTTCFCLLRRFTRWFRCVTAPQRAFLAKHLIKE